jgi:NosR/NirI family nitrous oxide reductase transcriptional regulator
MLVHNFWCTYLCPVGALMEIVLKVRNKVRTVWRQRKE